MIKIGLIIDVLVGIYAILLFFSFYTGLYEIGISPIIVVIGYLYIRIALLLIFALYR